MTVEKVIIGDCTLYRGDSREVVPALADGCADMILTDPPYGHNNNNGDLIHRWEAALGRLPSGEASPQGRPIANDGPEANDLARWMFAQSPRLLAAGGCCCCCCCCGGGGPDPQFARWSLWLDEHLEFKQMVVWDKGPMGMGWHYRRSYETVLVGMKPGAACRWYAETSDIENIVRPNAYGIRKIIPGADDHPTPKPTALAAHFVRLHSDRGHVVLDPFMGHGWVGEAAVTLGRRFIGIEVDESYFKVACRRIERAYADMALFQPPPAKQTQVEMFGGEA